MNCIVPLLVMQTTDEFGVATCRLETWDDVIVPTAGSCGVAKERMEDKENLDCKDWFFCTKKKLDEKEIYSKLIKD